MQPSKSNLLTLLFGGLCIVITFTLCHDFFDFPRNEAPAPAHNPAQALPSPPAQSEYEVKVVNPTIPPQVIGTWDPLKVAAEEITRFKGRSTNN